MTGRSDATQARWLPALLAFTACAVSLAAGAGFDLDAFDSAELALAAVTRGLAHPPGQPLHTLAGWLGTRAPVRPLAVLAWLSIVPAAMMPALALRAVGPPRVPARVWATGSVALGLLFAALPAVRDVACRIEVYPLAAALAVGAVLLARRRRARSDVSAGVLLGLAACVNPVMAAQGGGALVVACRGDWRGRLAVSLRMALGAVAGLAPYAYVFLARTRETGTLVWGAPHDAHGWVRLLSAADFRRNISVSPGEFVTHALRFAWDLTARGTMPLVLAGAVASLVWAPSRRRAFADLAALAVALGAGMLMIAANTPYLSNNPDYGGYVLVPVALALAAIAQAVAVESGDRTQSRPAEPAMEAPQRGRTRSSVRLSAHGSLAANFVAMGATTLALARGRPSGAIRALATEALVAAPRGAIVVLASDHLLFPALYLQGVEGLRRDVTVLNPGWASARWAWAWARERDPSLAVDLTPGLGGAARLDGVLRSRERGRAVLAEAPSVLRSVAPGAVCVRGVLWSSAEGCVGTRRWLERTRALLAREAGRARNDSGWDARVVYFTARALGDDAARLGCGRVAGALYRAGLGRVDGPAITTQCDGVVHGPPAAVSLLDVRQISLDEAIARLAVP